jgi:hypothetical protein
MTLWKEQKMIEWILERFNEGVSGDNYQKVIPRERIESLFLCYTCKYVWAMGKEGKYLVAYYYRNFPKYGKTKKECPHCAEKNGVV